jgi:hypothetical protein
MLFVPVKQLLYRVLPVSLISSTVGSFFLEAERARIRKGNSGTIPLQYKYLSMVG